MSINRATIEGNLGQDPEIKTFQDGGKLARLSVATTEKWKDKRTGEDKEETQWHWVVVRGTWLVENIVEPKLRKGSKVLIEGRIETRKWQDKEGRDQYTTEIVVLGGPTTIYPIDWPKAGNRPPLPDTAARGAGEGGAAARGGGGNAASTGRAPDLDDDIPF